MADEHEPVAASDDDLAIDDERLYEIVEQAVRDAMLDVFGTIALLLVSLLLLAAGARGLFTANSGSGAVLGGMLLGASVALAAYAFDVPGRVRG